MAEPTASDGTATLPPPSTNRSAPPPSARPGRRLPSRIGSLRIALIAGFVALILVVIFIVQNAHAVNIRFLAPTFTCRWPWPCSSRP